MIDEKLEALRAYFGSYSKLARAIDVTPQAIEGWKIRGFIPAGSAIEIEKVTSGEFKAVELVS